MDRFPLNVKNFTDGGISITPKKRVLTVSFGDGYEQVAQDGINADISAFNITWTDIKVDEADLVYNFLNERLMTVPFFITIPGAGENLKVKCISLTRSFSNIFINSISAEFKRDYTLGV